MMNMHVICILYSEIVPFYILILCFDMLQDHFKESLNASANIICLSNVMVATCCNIDVLYNTGILHNVCIYISLEMINIIYCMYINMYIITYNIRLYTFVYPQLNTYHIAHNMFPFVLTIFSAEQ